MSHAVLARRTSARGSNGRAGRAVVIPDKSGSENRRGAARRAAHRFITDIAAIAIPCWVADHASFRRWFHSDDFPEEGRVTFVNGEVIFDMSREQLYSHVRIKTIFTAVLNHLATRRRSGVFFGDGILLSNLPAAVSNNPDGTYVSKESFETNRVRQVEGAQQGYVELEGSPDMVLEVVSESSEKKDYELLRTAYWNAGIREYWLVDVRGERREFQILKHTRHGYVAARKVSGWQKSAVFGRAFRLVATTNPLGLSDFELKVR